jgi:hypothetical protein
MADINNPLDTSQFLGVSGDGLPGLWIGLPAVAPPRARPATSSPAPIVEAESSEEFVAGVRVVRVAPPPGRRPVDPEKLPPYLRDHPIFRRR